MSMKKPREKIINSVHFFRCERTTSGGRTVSCVREVSSAEKPLASACASAEGAWALASYSLFVVSRSVRLEVDGAFSVASFTFASSMARRSTAVWVGEGEADTAAGADD